VQPKQLYIIQFIYALIYLESERTCNKQHCLTNNILKQSDLQCIWEINKRDYKIL